MRNIHVCCYGNQAGKKKETFGPTELKEGGPELNIIINIILKSPGEISALLFLLVMFVNTVHILLLMMF